MISQKFVGSVFVFEALFVSWLSSWQNIGIDVYLRQRVKYHIKEVKDLAGFTG